MQTLDGEKVGAYGPNVFPAGTITNIFEMYELGSTNHTLVLNVSSGTSLEINTFNTFAVVGENDTMYAALSV